MVRRRSVAGSALTLLGTVGLAFAQTPGAKPGAAPTSFEDACARAEQRGSPVLLEFYTEW